MQACTIGNNHHTSWTATSRDSHFSPLVFSTSGGMGPSTTVTYKRLAFLLSIKWKTPYCRVMSWLRCRLGFSLLHTSMMCIRGSCSSSGRPQGVTFQLPSIWCWRRDTLGLFEPHLSVLLLLFSCPARALFVLGVVGKGSPSSPGKKIQSLLYIICKISMHHYSHYSPHVLKLIITSILIHIQKGSSNCNNKHYFRQLILLPSIAAPD